MFLKKSGKCINLLGQFEIGHDVKQVSLNFSVLCVYFNFLDNQNGTYFVVLLPY